MGRISASAAGNLNWNEANPRGWPHPQRSKTYLIHSNVGCCVWCVCHVCVVLVMFVVFVVFVMLVVFVVFVVFVILCCCICMLCERFYLMRTYLTVDNLFVDGGHYVIGDLGLVVPAFDKYPKTMNISHLFYKAPEVILGERNYSNKVDVWAFGMLLIVYLIVF
jgi:Protein kinase domain